MVNIDLQSLAFALGGEVSNNQVLCPGPGHSAKDRSLSVKLDADAPDGFIVNSFASDDAIECKDYVRAKLSLPAFKPNGGGGRRHRASTADISNMLAAAIELIDESEPAGRVVAAYDYTDDKGELLYQVLRYEPKGFSQRRPNGNGGWIQNIDGVGRVLYRLPELPKYPDACVFVCEGEKDADRVASLNLCATAVACGKWTNDCVQALTGRDVLILEDADKAGREKALKAARALHGTAATIRVVKLSGLTGHPNNKDVSDWLDADLSRGDKLADVCFDTPLWTPETASEEASTSNPPKDDTATEPPLSFNFINLTAWEGQPIPERHWAVLNRIPDCEVTLLSGEGAMGKSLILKQLAVATVTAKDWLGTMPVPGPVIYITAEEKIDELHFRLHNIIEHYGARFADLSDLHIRSMKGEDTILAHPNRNGIIQPTPLFEQLLKIALVIKPRWVGLDPAANLFAGNENDRSHVQQFIALLTRIAVQGHTAVVLVSHPSLTGINTGSGLSGSTAWHNSVRSRLYLKKAATEKGEEPDPNLRVLEVMKSNYGPPAEALTLRWKDGLFLPVAAPGSLERMAREQKVDDLFLKLLDRSTEQGRNLSDKKTAHTYAPSRFVSEPEAKADHISKRELAEAMERLFRAGKICNASYGLPSKGWTRLERK
jgi:RecA-family ATPase/5S rRNA maturation endonuclease (ribonuclease M5)